MCCYIGIDNSIVAAGIAEICSIIITITKHIIAQHALAGGNKCVRINEPAHLRVIISGLEVVQAGFSVLKLSGHGYSVISHPWKPKLPGMLLVLFHLCRMWKAEHNTY